MRLRRLSILDIDYKPLLKGVDLFFQTQDNTSIHTNCLVGINGSGKSQILEIIAEIFLFLENVYRNENKIKAPLSPFAFRIEYEIFKGDDVYLIIFECDKIKTKVKDIVVEIWKKNAEEIEEINIDNIDLFDYLPTKIIGYSSGDNETLSLPFDSYYDEYAQYTYERAFGIKQGNDYEPNLYFMSYNTNLGIAISSFIFRDELPQIDTVINKLDIDDLTSFTITIQTKQQAAPNRKKGGVMLTEELKNWRQILINIADVNIYEEKLNKNTLKFVLDKTTIRAFKDNFTSALELYTCLYKLELLNNLIVDKKTKEKIKKERKARRLVTKMPAVSDINKVLQYSELKFKLNNGEEIDYLSFSDGEHQFLNVFSTILMMNQENCLFLLDEPETHFNPLWRRTFINTLEKVTIERKQHFFITTHSPFIVSDCKKENVFIFKREKNKINIQEPKSETYGASFDNILEMAFQINPPISENSLQELQELENENNPEIIQKELSNFGDSLEKASLRNRIILLNSKK
ncbi:restriction system-associated AAA family ATPase [Flavobacterium sp. LHD-80]|uniref:restriction system-associated AAA family ATPase n=1 Tax=Flavobacterium sp. LHD-80 TaxID=3071411 RepID=UPI0027E08649|nr:restriction system-associated AAA family ATPase [Flavobacterium sp. LHD-80]MDQ6471411.1 restriction system-associated AAA family ATPase [Flavobacterium sp. LHD-80]